MHYKNIEFTIKEECNSGSYNTMEWNGKYTNGIIWHRGVCLEFNKNYVKILINFIENDEKNDEEDNVLRVRFEKFNELYDIIEGTAKRESYKFIDTEYKDLINLLNSNKFDTVYYKEYEFLNFMDIYYKYDTSLNNEYILGYCSYGYDNIDHIYWIKDFNEIIKEIKDLEYLVEKYNVRLLWI